MDFNEFLAITADEFQVQKSQLDENYAFRELPAWSSLNALVFISRIKDEFSVLINSKDLANCKSLGDLYEIIKSRS